MVDPALYTFAVGDLLAWLCRLPEPLPAVAIIGHNPALTDLVNAMASQMKAEREKRATILESEGFKQAEILKAEGIKQAKILEAEAREREAQAEAKATDLVSQAIAKGDPQAINYFVAQKYVDALKDIASAENQKVVLMPLEASNVIGSLGGIAEIAKSVFNKG